MPSVSPAQHRWIGWLHSDPAARERAGMSKAKVDEWLHSDRGSPWKHATGGIVAHRDDGGATNDPSSFGGIQPSAYSANPITQNAIQRYASLSTEQLQEYAARLGGTQQGQIIQRLLQQRHIQPQTQGAQQPQQQQTAQPQQQQQAQQPVGQQPSLNLPNLQPQATMKRGGTVPKKRDLGGGMSISTAEPWWTRREASQADTSGGGFLHGVTGGRADEIKTQAPGGAYVIPADVVSGLGAGNSLAGANIMNQIIKSTGPYGTSAPRFSHRSSIPRAPTPPRDTATGDLGSLERGGHVPIFKKVERKEGGVADNDNHAWSDGKRYTAVDLSDGEYVVAPEDVDRIGGGDRKAGHRILDRWVVSKREQHIKDLKKLKPPVGSRLKKKAA